PDGQSTVHQVRLEDSAVEIIHLEAQGLVRTVTRRRRQPLSGSSSVRSSSVTSFGSALPRTSAMTKFIIFPSALAPFALTNDRCDSKTFDITPFNSALPIIPIFNCSTADAAFAVGCVANHLRISKTDSLDVLPSATSRKTSLRCVSSRFSTGT